MEFICLKVGGGEVSPRVDKDKQERSLTEIIKAFSDDRTLLILKAIYSGGGETGEELRIEFNLSKKEYYSRISSLTRLGLVNRRKGRHFITSFGKLCYNAQRLIESAVRNHWKLKAIDALLKGENLEDMPREEREDIVKVMLKNRELREILLSENRHVQYS